jgi:hypothetical protein
MTKQVELNHKSKATFTTITEWENIVLFICETFIKKT